MCGKKPRGKQLIIECYDDLIPIRHVVGKDFTVHKAQLVCTHIDLFVQVVELEFGGWTASDVAQDFF